MRGATLLGVGRQGRGDGLSLLIKMDAHRVRDEGFWDSLRLRDIRPTRETVYGSKYAHHVIISLSSHLLQCHCTRQLLPYLVHRKIVNNEASARIVSKSDSEAAKSLIEELNEVIVSELGGESVIENFYLALLNCYEKSQNVWCRTMATSRLQPAVMAELKQLDVNHYDLPIVLQRLPSVQLVLQSASQLKYVLGLRGPVGGSATDLKQIIRQGMNEKHGFSVSDLVLGLLLTPSLGRYVTLLLPYCCCNPLEVYKLLLHLQHNWTKLANHFGYSQNEIDDIGAGGNDIPNQIQLFLRVWWMPDCGENKTCAFLQRVIQEKLHLPAMDDGQALLKACLNNDWRKAETLIRSGCHLGARCEDARTPLMHACRKGQDTLVQLLIDKGADPQVMDKRGDACLHFPETLRNRTILECILKEYQRLGVSVDVESLYSECSPLSIACKHLAVNSAELLLTYGADPNGCKNGKHRPLVEASAQGHVGLVRALLKWRPDVNATNKDGFTPLLQACTSNQWGVAQLLMDEGADVNKCGIDCTSPLFAAVSANSLPIAEKLIRKGAIIDAVRFQPGAVEGIVEMTPLSHAAGKGMNSMVELLIKNGANVNYLCSETMPALGFAIIGEQFETFHLLLQCENLDKSITGLSTSIITSVRTEKLYFTEHLLDVLGGPKTALMRAQQTQMELLVENILMYMQATNHPHLSEVGSMPEQYKAPPVAPTPQVRLHPEDQYKIDEVLTHFSRICMSAVLESPEIPHDSLVEIAQATGSQAVARFFRTVLSSTMSPEAMRRDFLCGTTSPIRFLIENKILTIEIFQVEVLKFHPDGGHQFYRDLVWTFQHMNGGSELPTNIHAMLTQLFSGRFTPIAPQRRSLNEGPREPMNEPVFQKHSIVTPGEEHVHSFADKANVRLWKPFRFKGINCKLCGTIPLQHSDVVRSKMNENLKDNYKKSVDDLNNVSSTPPSSTESEKTNVPLPPDKSKSVQNVVQNFDNNPPDTTDTNSDDTSSPPTSASATKRFSPVSATAAPDQSSPVQEPGNTSEASAVTTDSPEEEDFRLPTCTVNPTGTVLGHGSYGDVVEVEYRGKIYAAKKYRHVAVKNLIGVFGREHEILARIRHRNIVPYYGVCTLSPDNTTVIVMQRMEMNLSVFLEDKNNVNITLERKYRLLFDIAKGLHHLHTQKPAIIHRDLTATNVLLNSKGVAKIGDFGNSCMVDLSTTPELLTSNPGTLDYMPQEALEGGQYNDKLDIFSFGHLAIYIVIQHRPHPLLRHTYRERGRLIPRTEVERRAVYLDEVESKLGGDRHELHSHIISCLQDEPNMRPSCEYIVAYLLRQIH